MVQPSVSLIVDSGVIFAPSLQWDEPIKMYDSAYSTNSNNLHFFSEFLLTRITDIFRKIIWKHILLNINLCLINFCTDENPPRSTSTFAWNQPTVYIQTGQGGFYRWLAFFFVLAYVFLWDNSPAINVPWIFLSSEVMNVYSRGTHFTPVSILAEVNIDDLSQNLKLLVKEFNGHWLSCRNLRS